jgi:competence protein ComGC
VLSVISFFYIGIVFAIAIPNLIASYRAANEGSAMRTVKVLANAESVFQASPASAGKYGTMQELAAAGLIDATLIKNPKNNYVFEIKTDGSYYEAFATPVKDSDFVGRSFYFSSKEQFIRAAKKGGVPATVYDPPLNQDDAPRRTYEREPAPSAYQPAYQN